MSFLKWFSFPTMAGVRLGPPTYNSIARRYIEMHKHGSNFNKVYNNIKRQLSNDRERAIKALIAAEILLDLNSARYTASELALIYNKMLPPSPKPAHKNRFKIVSRSLEPAKKEFRRIILNTKKELISGKIKFMPNVLTVVPLKPGQSIEGLRMPRVNKKAEHINFIGATVPPNKVNAFYNQHGPRILNAMTYYKFNPSVSKKQALVKFFGANQLRAIYNQYPKRTTNNGGRSAPNNPMNNWHTGRFISTRNGKTFEVSQRAKTKIMTAPKETPETVGAYLYLLSDKNKLYFVPVENQFEVYGKHLHIVAAKSVTGIDAAGEMVISPDGKKVTFNLLSGTFMIPSLHNTTKFTNITWRKNKIKVALQSLYPTKTIKFVHGYNTLLPTNNVLAANSASSKKYLNSKLNYINYTMTNDILGN